jgi:hypothetical protein
MTGKLSLESLKKDITSLLSAKPKKRSTTKKSTTKKSAPKKTTKRKKSAKQRGG